MAAAPLNYALPDTARSRPPWLTLGIIGGLLLFALLLPPLTTRQVESSIDPVTGSMRWKTVWLLGITSGTRVNVSPLETRLKRSGIAWARSWHFLHNTRRNLFGRAAGYDCGSAPAIYDIQPILGEFAAASSDDELREFVRVMESGTELEQNAAVEAAGEKGLRHLSAPAPSTQPPQ